MVKQILTFSRGTKGQHSPIHLEFLVKEMEKLIRETFPKTVRVESAVCSLRPVLADPTQIHQVLLNLCVNAKDAMPGGGTLTITTGNGHNVRVTVADTGSGIAQEHIHRIYDPFFTTKSKPKSGHSGGTGLGLSVTYGIIQEHAGKIHVESAPGHGTLFTMEFPMVRKVVNA